MDGFVRNFIAIYVALCLEIEVIILGMIILMPLNVKDINCVIGLCLRMLVCKGNSSLRCHGLLWMCGFVAESGDGTFTAAILCDKI